MASAWQLAKCPVCSSSGVASLSPATIRSLPLRPGAPASFHVVTIKADSAIHYHKRQTEIYHVLQGTGVIWLDGRQFPLRKGSTVLIPPLVRHRARGRLTIVHVVIPAFDPADKYVEDAAGQAGLRQPCRSSMPPACGISMSDGRTLTWIANVRNCGQ